MNYIKKIRDLREDNDKTQTDIANFLGIKQTVYSRYEVGKNEIPLHHLIKLAEYYDVSLDYICGLTRKRNPFPNEYSKRLENRH